jgi:hypothetical protein
MNGAVTRLDDVSPSWLARGIDDEGVVRLRGVFSPEWLAAMRASVADHAARHGDGDFYVARADHETGSAAHRLVSDPEVRRLFSETAGHRWPETASAGKGIRCSMFVRAGTGPKLGSNRFHYDDAVLTMVVPIFIPHGELGRSGELATFGNKRPYRRFFGSHLVDQILTYNSLYRRHVAKMVLDAPEKHVVDLEPGDAYLFWGYRTFHGNFDCADGLLRTTLVLQYGEVHADSRWKKVAWQLSRSRRDVRRWQYRPSAPADAEVPAELA